MLSVVGTCTLCVLLLLGAQALSGKNDNVTKIEETVQTLSHDQVPVRFINLPLAEVEIRQDGNPVDQNKTKGNEEMAIEDTQQTKKEEAYKPQFNQQQPTKVQEALNAEHEYKLPITIKQNIDPYVRINFQNQPSIDTGKGKNEQKSIKVQDNKKKKVEDQVLIKIDEKRKGEIQKTIQIEVHESCEHDLEGGQLITWTKMQTRAPKTGPILGFKKGSFRFARRMTSCLSKAPSALGRTFSRKSKKGMEKQPSGFERQPSELEEQPGLDRQPSVSEETVSAAPKSASPKPPSPQQTPPSPKPPTKGLWLRKESRPSRKDYEKFRLEDEINEIVMIPGSGEFVYDTIIQKKTAIVFKPYYKIEPVGPATSINEHNTDGVSDAILSLNQLKEDLPNVEWVSVVVNWFGNSLNIKYCDIYPAVEFQGDFMAIPEDWRVGNTVRRTAKFTSRDWGGNPKYGGTVSDGALKRYINELHSRGYKVMLYPMLVLDTDIKEWRGRLTGQLNDIKQFFKNKYNPFIKHYSNIAKETEVEAFIIGSEFVGLTRLHDKQYNYPAVTEFVKLAKEVKTDLGSEVTVTYAADWTEYHMTSDGYYPMDELWGSEYIDVVGINAYFPLTDSREPDGGWSVDDIVRSWTAGEGYSYYYDYTNKEKPELKFYPDGKESVWAVKNIPKWWRELHFNADDTVTKWQPEMKKIWFTEYGFPSVNGCASEPYVFVEGSGTEVRYPRYSSKEVSFTSQRVAIAGTIKKWRNSEMVERMFLYAWDARPLPYFPMKQDVWGDGSNWETGHWVQGKVGRIEGHRRDEVRSARRRVSMPKRHATVVS